MSDSETKLQRQAIDDMIAALRKAGEDKAADLLVIERDTKYPLPKVKATLMLGEGVLASWQGKTVSLQQEGRAVLLRRTDLQRAATFDAQGVDANGDEK